MFDSRWVFVSNKRHEYDISNSASPDEAEEEGLCSTLDHITYSATDVLQRKIKRLEARLSSRDATVAERDKKIQQLEQEKVVVPGRVIYAIWKRICDKYFAMDKHTSFIDSPFLLQRCQDLGCVARKKDNRNIKVCKHEMEVVLRGSGQYNIKFLRTERLRWHPDQFARKCEILAKQQLPAKAAQMFAIMEELIAEEVSRAGPENTKP